MADDTAPRPIRDVPHYGDRLGEIRARLAAGPPALFLDFDGTLAPIVDDPGDAAAPAATLELLARLVTELPIAVVSGRDLDDVRARVPVDGIAVAGSHGFELLHADGVREDRAAPYSELLDAVEADVRAAIAGLEDVTVERKAAAVAVHTRRAAPPTTMEADRRVAGAIAATDGIDMERGKEIIELTPDVDWHKGRVVELLLSSLPETTVPVYIGDDVTDEDAFAALTDRGIGIVVRGERDSRATRADYTADDPDDVRRLLGQLAGLAGV